MDWDYEKYDGGHKGRPHGKVAARCVGILRKLRRGTLDKTSLLSDTRPVHLTLFRGLTPAGMTYFAGNYRGSPYPVLDAYNVQIGGQPGTFAPYVAQDMAIFSNMMATALQDVSHHLAMSHLPEDEQVLYATTFATWALVTFLRIHPYANGNGHISRFIVWAFMGSFDIWPKSWPFESRPGHPYDANIARYVANDRDPLIQMILAAVVDTPPLLERVRPWRSWSYLVMRIKAFFGSLVT